jgi:mannose-1-phosphate guanylyltransferase
MPSSGDEHLWALIMAGGAGTRFWPLSRRRRPKQLLRLVDAGTLLAATVERVAPIIPPERTLVVTVADVAGAIRQELPAVPEGNILVEPVGRDTAPCIAWAAWRLAARHPDAAMVVLPSDHVVKDGEALRAALLVAVEWARRSAGLVALAIRPTRPETGFGYLELCDPAAEAAGLPVVRVRRFVEKPDRATAEGYLRSGNFRWNGGIFAWTCAALMAAVRAHLPALAERLDALMADAMSRGEEAALADHYPGLPRVSIDFGVMEKATNVWAVPVEFAWSDLGSWPSLGEVRGAQDGVVAIGDTVAVDSPGAVLVSDGPLIATIGARDLVVVATSDVVLVVPRARAQEVKALVERLRALGRDELL